MNCMVFQRKMTFCTKKMCPFANFMLYEYSSFVHCTGDTAFYFHAFHFSQTACKSDFIWAKSESQKWWVAVPKWSVITPGVYKYIFHIILCRLSPVQCDFRCMVACTGPFVMGLQWIPAPRPESRASFVLLRNLRITKQKKRLGTIYQPGWSRKVSIPEFPGSSTINLIFRSKIQLKTSKRVRARWIGFVGNPFFLLFGRNYPFRYLKTMQTTPKPPQTTPGPRPGWGNQGERRTQHPLYLLSKNPIEQSSVREWCTSLTELCS